MKRELFEVILRVIFFILVPAICYYSVKKTDRRNYNWKDIIWIIIFAYLWSFLNIFIHECGHAFTALAFGHSVSEISVGVGWNLAGFLVGNTKIAFNTFPVAGYTRHPVFFNSNKIKLLVLAMGVITQFLFLYLVYWLLKRNEKWRENIIGYFCYNYAIKMAFWLTFVLNFPFVSFHSDWTRIVVILLRLKWY